MLLFDLTNLNDRQQNIFILSTSRPPISNIQLSCDILYSVDVDYSIPQAKRLKRKKHLTRRVTSLAHDNDSNTAV